MFIDLSVILNEETPVYPGDPNVKITAAGNLENDGYCDHYISIGTHAGTHIDAPMHMVKNGASLDKIPLDQFIGQGKYVEIVDDNFDVVRNVDIEEGDIVIFHTGMSDKYAEPMYFEDYPVLSKETAQYLISKKVKMVGLDTGSADIDEDFPIHKLLLSNNILIIENLTNLSALKGKEFKIYALPLHLQIDGSPARVVAEIA